MTPQTGAPQTGVPRAGVPQNGAPRIGAPQTGALQTGAPQTGPQAGVLQTGALLDTDAARCAQLEALLFPEDDPWSERAFRDELRMGHLYRAARDGEVLVGYAGLAFVAPPPGAEAEVHTIGVDPAHQGRGIGRALLRELLAVADEASATVFLEVRTDNEVARGLYESEGFAVVGLRKRYYQPSGADAHTMRREPA